MWKSDPHQVLPAGGRGADSSFRIPAGAQHSCPAAVLQALWTQKEPVWGGGESGSPRSSPIRLSPRAPHQGSLCILTTSPPTCRVLSTHSPTLVPAQSLHLRVQTRPPASTLTHRLEVRVYLQMQENVVIKSKTQEPDRPASATPGWVAWGDFLLLSESSHLSVKIMKASLC